MSSEGNSAHYVTGGGQTQATRDRVFIYETEGDCKPIKRVKRKSKIKLDEEEEELALAVVGLLSEKRDTSDQQVRKKPTLITKNSKDRAAPTSASDSADIFSPLRAPSFCAQPLAIPVISPRSQSSFSQAASVIANFGQVIPPTPLTSATSLAINKPCHCGESEDTKPEKPSPSFIVSPRECYLDIQPDGTVVKKYSPRSGSVPLPSSLMPGDDIAASTVVRSAPLSTSSIPTPLFLTKGGSSASAPGFNFPSLVSTDSLSLSLVDSSSATPLLLSSSTSTFDRFVDAIGTVSEEAGGASDQLAMLREASADSDL